MKSNSNKWNQIITKESKESKNNKWEKREKGIKSGVIKFISFSYPQTLYFLVVVSEKYLKMEEKKEKKKIRQYG
jgi:hypothetical protein